MRIAVADTGPINYLLQISRVDVLSALCSRVLLPSLVRDELSHAKAPTAVRRWVATPPAWIEIVDCTHVQANRWKFGDLGPGEAAAIQLSAEIGADILIMDDRAGVSAAISSGIRVTGTLGILAMAARRGLVDLPSAFADLRATNFHCSRTIMDQVLRDSRR